METFCGHSICDSGNDTDTTLYIQLKVMYWRIPMDLKILVAAGLNITASLKIASRKAKSHHKKY